MNASTLPRLYDRLTPAERFRARVAADARDDYEEVRRLEDSTPKKTYTMHDWDFETLQSRALGLAHAYAAGWHPHFSRWLFWTMLPGSKAARKMKSRPPKSRREDFLAFRAVLELGGIDCALRRVCERIGVDLEQFRTGYLSPLDDDFKVIGPLLSIVDADREDALPEAREAAARWFRIFRNAWGGTVFASAFADGGPFQTREDIQQLREAMKRGEPFPAGLP